MHWWQEYPVKPVMRGLMFALCRLHWTVLGQWLLGEGWNGLEKQTGWENKWKWVRPAKTGSNVWWQASRSWKKWQKNTRHLTLPFFPKPFCLKQINVNKWLCNPFLPVHTFAKSFVPVVLTQKAFVPNCCRPFMMNSCKWKRTGRENEWRQFRAEWMAWKKHPMRLCGQNFLIQSPARHSYTFSDRTSASTSLVSLSTRRSGLHPGVAHISVRSASSVEWSAQF